MKTFNARFGAWTLLLSLLGSPFATMLQAQTPCAFAISPSSGSHNSGTSTGLVSVTTSAGCAWNVINTNGWLSIMSGSNGSGNGIVRYFVSANAAGSARVGYLLVADQWFSVTQSASTSAPCSFLLSPGYDHYNAGAPASTGSVSVTTAPGCAWTAFSSNSWLTVLSSPSNSGNGTVVYSAAANSNSSVRLGIIWIAGQMFTVGQDGFPCEYTLTPTNRIHGSGASTNTVTMSTTPGCSWTVFTTNTWINILSSEFATGNGTVTYSVAANTSPASRSGALVIGGRLFTITQPGIDCGYSLSPTTRSYGSGATNDIVSIIGPTICPWTAATPNAWITILSIPTGTGNGAVFYGVAANPNSLSRTGSIIIAGQTLAITQAAADPVIVQQPLGRNISPGATTTFSVGVAGTPPFTFQWQFNGAPLADGAGITGSSTSNLTLTGAQESQSGNYRVMVSNPVGVVTSSQATLTMICNYSISPTNHAHGYNGATGTVYVTASEGCAWDVSNSNSWVTVLWGASGTGYGSVIYVVAENPDVQPRSGNMTIAGQSFSVSQAGRASATNSLAEALDTVDTLSWATIGIPAWFAQTLVSHDGVDAAQSGAVSDSGAVTVTTTVNGPGTISFWWKVSSQTNSDYLKFFTNGVQQIRISGEVDWQLRSLPIAAGTNILKWTYSKNGSGAAGLDKSWLDQVRFLPGTGCVVTLSRTNAAHSGNSETGQVNVAASEGCMWAVDNTNSWITPLVDVGEGNGDFRYTVAANTSPLSRTGVITIGGRPFTVVQALNPAFCFGAISPASRMEYSGPGYGTVALTMEAGCTWSVVNTNPWVAIASSVSYPGGGGMVTYHVDANTNTQARSGNILIAGIAFLLMQAEASQPGTNVPPLPQYADFDVGRDFSTVQNPNGVWTFGWAGSVTGSVNPLTVRRDSPADNGASTPSWQLTYDTAPVVICNISNQVVTVEGGQAALAPHEVLFDGGQDGSPENFVVIRFTAPSNGVYSVVTAVRPFYNGSPQGDADFHVVRNSSELFVQFINPYQSAYYSNTLAMSAGETVKFLLGRGTDGHEYGSIFRIAALINPRSNTTNPPAGLPFITFTNRTPDSGEDFGYSVAALGNDRVLIGAPRRDGTNSSYAGAAYLFGTNGALLATFNSPTPAVASFFGWSVTAVGNDRVFIGAPYGNSGGVTGAGVAYLFSTNGTLLTTFANPLPAYDNRFGWSVVAVGSDRVLIGALKDDTGIEDTGAAYLFNIDGTLLATFNNPSPGHDDSFGSSMAMVGSDRVLFGARGDWTSGPQAGIAYLFSTNGTLLTTINNPTPAGSEYFGCAVAAVGTDLLLIGAYGEGTGASMSGVAYLFSIDGALLTTFSNPAPAYLDYFGMSVIAVGSDRVLIGAPAENYGASNDGTAYLFSTNGTLLATFRNPTPSPHAFFGNAMAVVGSDRVLVGAFNHAGRGAAYLFSLPPAGGTTNPPVNLTGFDAARDFSTNSNPNAVWSYGWKSTLAGALTLLPNTRQAFAPNNIPYDLWDGEGTLPTVMHYPWSNPDSGINGTSTLPPGSMVLDPGWEGSGKNFVVVRFIAPSNSFYRIETAVAPLYDGYPQGDTDFHVVKNGAELVGRFLAPPEHFSYVTALLLNSGDTIDFAVGRGADDLKAGSALKLTAVLTPTNAPVCTYGISPTSQSVNYFSETRSFTVTAPAGCAWSVVNTNDWVTILSATNGSGNTTVNYSISSNTTLYARSGNIRVGTQLLSLSQAVAPMDFAEAIDIVGSPIRVWAIGYPGWTGQSNVTHDGVDAALSSGGSFTLVATGAATLTFWWKVSSQTNSNLRLYVAGAEQFRITGEVDWEQRTIAIPAGVQAMEWHFDKRAEGNAEQAWVDQVQFVPAASCPVTLSPGSASHPSSSSTGLVSVAAAADCAWSVFNTNAWVSIAAGSNGSGNGLVRYVVAPNPSPVARSGIMIIGAQNYSITQNGGTGICSYAISPTNRTHGYGSASNFVTLTTASGCDWVVLNTNSWVTITSATNGSGSGVINYTVTANPSASARSGNISMAGKLFAVTQSGNTNPPAGCTISISPGSRTHGSDSATGLVTVTTQSGCAWSVVKTNSWISILSSLNNSNSGTVLYSLAPNTNAQARAGNVMIGGQQFLLTQGGTSVPGTNAARLQFMGRTGTNATLSVQGEAGKMYVMECSEDLIHWIPISTNSAPSTVTDAAVGNAPHRFYRTVEHL